MGSNVVKLVMALVVIAVVAGGAFWLFSRGSKPDTALSGTPTQDLSFQDYSGKTLKLSDFRGRPLVINSWAAWCPFCVKELPDFVRAQEEFGDKVMIIAIDRAESLETAKEFSDRMGVTGRITIWLDAGDSFYTSIGGFSMPETIFVNAEGMIVDHKRGPMTVEEMRSRIKKLFNL